ncbi:hypothetical protein [Kitasatospora sp. GAS204B]|nr:hypothetical protein [Kitasatospora sp. GAS204B]MDH6122940.1 hypothetical protein [Kitasatospora sp. GAS204B]
MPDVTGGGTKNTETATNTEPAAERAEEQSIVEEPQAAEAEPSSE